MTQTALTHQISVIATFYARLLLPTILALCDGSVSIVSYSFEVELWSKNALGAPWRAPSSSATMALAGRWMGRGGINGEHELLKIKGFPGRDKFIFI